MKEKSLLFLRYYTFNGLLFSLCYFGANHYAEHAATRYVFFFAWETSIPFVPLWIYVYLSILVWFWMPLFLLNKPAIARLSRAFALTTLAAAVVFMLFPAESPFDRSLHVLENAKIYHLLYWLDKPHNLFPSLHIAYVVLYLAVFWREKSAYLAMCTIWGVLMMFSVLPTHQHTLMDIFGGIVLGLLVFFSYYEISRRRHRE